jgi:acyl-CoA synthetase (AMP-forming)/AMP-acid ligase II
VSAAPLLWRIVTFGTIKWNCNGKFNAQRDTGSKPALVKDTRSADQSSMGVNICQLVFDQAERRPGELAVISRAGWMSYARLARQVGLLATHLENKGVKPGDKVVTVLRYGLNQLLGMLAIARLGACSIPVSALTTGARRGEVIRQHGPEWVLVDNPEDGPQAYRSIVMPKKLDEMQSDAELAAYDAGHLPCLAQLSSVPSGLQEASSITHAQILERLLREGAHYEAAARVGVPSINAYSGAYAALRVLADGRTLCILTNSYVLDEIDLFGVTHLTIGMRMALSMVEALDGRRGMHPRLERLDLCGWSSEPLAIEMLRSRICPSVSFRLEESTLGCLTQAQPTLLDKLPTTTGKPGAGIKIRIVDDHGKPLPESHAGWVQVRDDTKGAAGVLMPETVGADEWLSTGLIGRLAGGLLFPLGEAGELIKIGGDWVNLGLIEQVLRLHPGVRDAVVDEVPRPDGSGTCLVAAVVSEQLQVSELRRHCRTLMQGPIPDSFMQVEGLPDATRRQFLQFLSRAGMTV